MSRVKVTINKKGHIPHLGTGPIKRPVLITEELCNELIKLGYPVKVLNKPILKTTNKPSKSVSGPFIPKVEDKVEKEIKEEDVSKSEEEVKQEESSSEEIVVTENTVEVQDEPAAIEETVIEEQPIEEKVEVVEEEIASTEEELVEEVRADKKEEESPIVNSAGEYWASAPNAKSNEKR